jgi:hypothetical protein
MLSFAFCTTAMNRKAYIAQSLGHNLQALQPYPTAVIVLLDYNSKDGLGEYVKEHHHQAIETGRLHYCRTDEPAYFHMSHAKNVAHRLGIAEVSAEVLINTDAEMLLPERFVDRLEDLFSKTRECVFTNQSGRVAIGSEHFMQLGGYDESFNGWGVEDNDLRHRAQRLGLTHIQQSSGSEIGHSDHERTVNYAPDFRHAGKSNESNYRLFEKNNADSVIAVNRSGHWGRAKVRINWARDVTMA